MNRGRAPGPGRLWKRRDLWVLDYRDAQGKRRRRTLGTDKRVAERRRMALINQRDMELDGLGSIDGQSRPLADVVAEYLEDLEPRVSPAHFAQVKSRLERTLRELGDLRVRDLRPADLVRVRNRRLDEGSGHRTANLVVTTLQAALRWAVENQVIAANPVEHVKRLPETRDHQRYRRRAMTEDEIERFLAAAQEDDEQADIRAADKGMVRVPQVPLWLTLLETGARWNELRQATWGDLDVARRVVILRAENTKSKKQRVIPLRDELAEQLGQFRVLQETLLRRLPNVSDPIFRSPEGYPWGRPSNGAMRIFDRVLERAGIAKVDVEGRKLDLHAIRHTFASRLARSGVPLAQAQRLLGHSDPKLTAQVYTHLDVEDLRGAIERPSESRREPPVRRTGG